MPQLFAQFLLPLHCEATENVAVAHSELKLACKSAYVSLSTRGQILSKNVLSRVRIATRLPPNTHARLQPATLRVHRVCV